MTTVFAMLDTKAVSGPCRGLFQLVEHTKDLGMRYVVGMFLGQSADSTPAIQEAQRRGIEVAVLSQRRRYDPLLIVQALKVIREQRVTALQSHGYKPALIACCCKFLTGLPWVAFAHGYTSENLRMAFYNRLDRWLMRRADRVVAVSDAMSRLLCDAGVSKGRIRVICNAIDPNDHRLDADGTEFRRIYGIGSGDLLVGVIGRLSPEKGHALFVRAFQEVSRVVPNAKAVFVGEGQELAALRTAVNEAGLDDRVRFAGFHADMSPVYAALDLVIIPSLSEGLPNVLLEAMLHRRAVVATAVGGIREVMRGKLSKWLVPGGNPEALAGAVIHALQDPALRAELGEAGERHVREVFLPARRAAQVTELYRELAGKSCPFCSAGDSVRQICSERYIWGGIPFGCAKCGGSYFQRSVSTSASDEYWEGDAVNEKVYTVPAVRSAFVQKYEKYLALLDRPNNSARNLLEIGCGTGIFLETASRHGWVVHGLDVSAQAVELTRRNCPGAVVLCAPPERAELPPGTFDTVALWDVIEHVEDPEALLKFAHRLLRPHGVLILETPDESCLARRLVRLAHRLTGGRVSLLRFFYYPAHRWYFSRQAMSAVLRRTGFGAIHFYREQTVREFGKRKVQAYGLAQTWSQRVTTALAPVSGMVPWFRNKMVVMVVK